MTAYNPRQTTSAGGKAPAHTMSRIGLLRLLIGCLVTICTIPSVADSARPGRGEVATNHVLSSNDQSFSGGGLHYYGILGQVGQPGSYSSTKAQLTLAELVAAAGDLTKDAVRLAKVIRQGPAGLELVNLTSSADQLIPGDVVVFDRLAANLSSATSTNPMKAVDVAFVGLDANQPIVVSLKQSDASLRQLVATLGQHPALISTIQVVRTSPTAPRTAPGQQPSTLHDGDIVVFRPETINVEALASAATFPRPIPVNVPLPTQAVAVDRPGQAMPAQSKVTLTLVPPHVEQEPTRGNGVRAGTPLSDSSMTQLIATTSMVGDSAIPSESAPAPLRAVEEEANFIDQPDFAADSFTRLAMADPSGEESHQRPEPATATQRVVVPPPFDNTTLDKPDRRGSRTTTLGITVLIIAVICFAASMLWSRIDDAGSLAREEYRDVKVASHHDSAVIQRRTLDQLIDNALPLIEEQASLPERIEYHGEAVGRRRIRIDARHGLVGPHFSKSSNAIPQTETISSASSAAPSAGEKQFRIDTPGASSGSETGSEGSTHAGRKAMSKLSDNNSGGLLERILVAMEREKRP